jgi:biopolymer transport protein ExbD
MAFKPSARRNTQTLDLDLDIRPVMNLMVVLIPLLLAGTVFLKLAILEIDLPPTASGGGAGDEANQPEKEQEKKLSLKIIITKQGFTIASASAILSGGEAGEGPTVPVNSEGEYNFGGLKEKLIEIKKQIDGKGFKDENSAIITASRDIEYQTIVFVIDAMRMYEDEQNNPKLLFPQINFGQVL